MAGHSQSPQGVFAEASTRPYLNEKEVAVRRRPLVMGLRMLTPSPTRWHPYQLLLVQYSPV